jgi:hypothetical protein
VSQPVPELLIDDVILDQGLMMTSDASNSYGLCEQLNTTTLTK